MIYGCDIDFIPVGTLFAYDFMTHRFVLCRKTENGKVKLIGNTLTYPDQAMVATLRVLEPKDEENLLCGIVSRSKHYMDGWTHPASVHPISVSMHDPWRTEVLIDFMAPARVGLLDVCLIYHEISSAIASRTVK